MAFFWGGGGKILKCKDKERLSDSVVNKTSIKKDQNNNELWSVFEIDTLTDLVDWNPWECKVNLYLTPSWMSYEFHLCESRRIYLGFILTWGHKWLQFTFGCLNCIACSHTPRSWCSQLGSLSWNWAGCRGTVQRILPFPEPSLLSDSWTSSWSPRQKLREEKNVKNISNFISCCCYNWMESAITGDVGAANLLWCNVASL